MKKFITTLCLLLATTVAAQEGGSNKTLIND